MDEIGTMRKSHKFSSQIFPLRHASGGMVLGFALSLLGMPAGANGPLMVTPSQKATAQEVAQKGVALEELASNAPERYTVKSGDTLWAISGLFLKSPWRWPQLWGMNLQDIQNPHRIYPGQVLVLDKSGGRAVLKVQAEHEHALTPAISTVKVSPATRFENLKDDAIPALNPRLIEPFLAQPMIVDIAAFEKAPRFVATQESRVLMSKGDRAYARSVYQDAASTPQLLLAPGKSRTWRAYRNATALKDPGTGEVLAYEAQFLGRAYLLRGESTHTPTKGSPAVPATLDIIEAKEEIRTGDRLISDSERNFLTYAPHAPESKVQARILASYSAVLSYASTNQVVSLNKGSKDGLAPGHVLAILRDKMRVEDKTDPSRPDLDLPVERNGLLMVFQTFDRVSYALILNSTDGVKVGDQVVNPR